MPKYQFSVTIEGFIEIEAESESDAEDIMEDGFSLASVEVTDTEHELLGEVNP